MGLFNKKGVGGSEPISTNGAEEILHATPPTRQFRVAGPS
jgi:hypothetical protein